MVSRSKRHSMILSRKNDLKQEISPSKRNASFSDQVMGLESGIEMKLQNCATPEVPYTEISRWKAFCIRWNRA